MSRIKKPEIKVSEVHSVTPQQARNVLLSGFDLNQSFFLWGPPGVGKSELVAGIAEEKGGLIIDMRMAQMEPTDLRGIPFFNQITKKMDWADPSELPSQELADQYPFIILFLDEMNSAPTTVQGAAYQLILNGRIGTYVKPKNVKIIAAGNRDSDRGVTYRMPMPLANRFIHIEMREDFASWQTWALLNGAHESVVSYLSFAEHHMFVFDTKSISKAFPTPRTWMFVSDVMNLNDVKPMSDSSLFTLVSGCVGQGVASEFMEYRRIGSKLPKAIDILNGTVKTLDIKDISAMYSLTVSMCFKLKEISDSNLVKRKEFNEMFDNFLGYMMTNFDDELVVLGGRIAMKTYEIDMDAHELTNFKSFHKKVGQHILDAVQTV
jgi:ATPase family associated with various cellular activities (AAA)